MARNGKNRENYPVDNPEAEAKLEDELNTVDTEAETEPVTNSDGQPIEQFPGEAPVEPAVTLPDATPEDLVHDEQGNVRPEFAPLGIGEVTAADVIRSNRFDLRQREDGEYDVYDLNDGHLIAVGVSADPEVLRKYL